MKISYLLITIFFLLGILNISGCESQSQSMIEKGYPPEYAQGYEDGCHSGKRAGGSLFDQFTKDVRRFEQDSEYSKGWNDGFRQCKSEQDAMEQQIQTNTQQQQLAEEKRHNEKMEEKNLLKGVDTSGLENLK